MTLLVVGVAVPASAQIVVNVPGTNRQQSRATPDAVVARLMSFDSNHDGLLARNELPERMQGLFTRADLINKDGPLDAQEVRRLAERPATQGAVRGFQPGQYGFGDGFDFDTRLHIDGAVEDLRLASATKDKVLGIVHAFQQTTQANAEAELLAGMTKLLTSAQMADFKAAIANQRVRSVPTLQSNGVTIFGATPAEIAGRKLVLTPLAVAGIDPGTQIQEYGLSLKQMKSALGLIETYQQRKSGRFTDADRTALVAQLKGVIDNEQRDDLRAALERRPIVKQGGVQNAGQIIVVPRPVPNPAPTFGLQDLVFRQ